MSVKKRYTRTNKVRKKSSRIRLKEKRRRQRIIRTVSSIALLFVVFIFIAWLSYHPNMLIKKVSVDGTVLINSNSVKETVDKIIFDDGFHIFSPANKFLFSRRNLELKIIEEFPSVLNVNVSVPGFGDILRVKIKERIPKYKYCDKTSRCFFADEHGYIFLSEREGYENLTAIDDSDNEKNIRDFILPEKLMSSLKKLILGLKDAELEIEKVVLQGKDAIFYVKDKSFFIKTALDKSVDEQIFNLQTVLNSGEMNDKLSHILYFDLRFGNKIFYKTGEDE